MGKAIRIHLLLLVLLLLFSVVQICSTEPVHAAIANPDSITLYSIKAFQNIFEDDDVLFLMSYEVEYTTEPTEDASATFQMAIYGTDGSTLIQARPLNYYQYNIHSIYFDADEADSDLTWGSAYVVRVMGNPSCFPMTEDTTMDSQTLSSYSWITGDSDTSPGLLTTHCIDLAEDLEDAWSLTLITTTPDSTVLNSAGRTVFLDAIPGLDSALDDLFQVSSSYYDYDPNDVHGVLEEETQVVTRLGSSIDAAFSGIGDFFGVSGLAAAGGWITLFIMTIASIVFLNSGNTIAAMILSVPIVIMGVWLGAISVTILFVLAIVIFLYMSYHIWLRGM